MKERRVLALTVAMLCALIFIACQPPTTSTGEGIDFLPPNPNPPHRNAVVVQFCNQSTEGSDYQRSYYTNANALMSAAINNALRVNQDGFAFYTTAITNVTFHETAQSSLPPVQVKAFPPYSTPPKAPPVPDLSNPVTKKATETAYTATVEAIATGYAQSGEQLDNQVAHERTVLMPQLQALKNWNATVTQGPQSVMGCLQLARARFQNMRGIKLLYIASNLDNRDDVTGGDGTEEFVRSHGLQDVHIRFMYLSSPNAAIDHDRRTFWCKFVRNAGAMAIMFSDPNASDTLISPGGTDDLFAADAQINTGCPGY